jgi:uncharacterized Zn-finger protein
MPELIEEIEEFYVDSKSVACDGGGGVLGHPRVFLAIEETGRIECPYCSRRFVYDPEKAGTNTTVEIRVPA